MKSLLYSLEQPARCIDLYLNSDKTELACFKQDGTISISKSEPLKLVDLFTYLGSNISSTKSDGKIYTGKAWAAFDKLSINLISDKLEILSSCKRDSTIVYLHHLDKRNTLRKS